MQHLRWTVLGAVALILCAVPVAVAKPPGGAVIKPVHSSGGLSAGELLGESWAVTFRSPPGAFVEECIPLAGSKVAFPLPGENFTSFCTVKPGTAIVIAPGAECSDVEEEPFFGEDAAAQRACALAFDEEFFVTATMSVDGGSPVNIRTRRFELFSPQMTVDLPEDNVFGIPAQTMTFVAHAWAAMVGGLTPGEHTIAITVTASDESVTTALLTVDVVPPGRAR